LSLSVQGSSLRRWPPRLLFAALVLPAGLPAQADPPPPRRAATVDTVIILRQDVFDSLEAGSWLPRLANDLHVTTRTGVVRNELLFRAGEPYDSARFAETARNLRRLGIFRDVVVDTVRVDSALAARVITRDGWSTRLNLSFHSTGSQIAFTVGAAEDNLLGTATRVQAQYQQNPDRSAFQLGFYRPRLIARTLGVGATYRDLSDGRDGSVVLDAPFYSLETKRGMALGAAFFSGRVLRFTGGESVPGDTLQERFALFRGEGAIAPRADPSGYLRVGLTAQVQRSDFVAQSFVGAIPQTVTGALGPFVRLSRARYLLTRNFMSLGHSEDVDISSTVGATAWLAPKAFGYPRAGLGPAIVASTGFRLPGGFGIASAKASGLFSSAGLDSGSVILTGTVALQPGARHLVLLHADGGWQKNAAPGQEFDLGLGLGPRAFPAHAFTGDRAFFTTAEYRWTVTEEILRIVALGVAGFADYGGAWYSGTPARTGTDFGLGLRIGSSRVPTEPPARIDLAYRLANDVEPRGWVLVIQKGFPFQFLRYDL